MYRPCEKTHCECEMLIPNIVVGLHFSRVPELTITIERYIPRVPNPTTKELGMCPASFRCYACLERKGRKRFGGAVLAKRICRECYPFVDEAVVGSLIRFDEKHGFNVE